MTEHIDIRRQTC